MRTLRSFRTLLAVVVGLGGWLTPLRGPAATEWNDEQIQWLSFEKGVVEARQQHKPMLMVLYADWCDHCHRYSRVFNDPKVVAKASQFVMVRLDIETNRGLAGEFVIDGDYVPRTVFMTPDGDVQRDVHAARSDFAYFFDESDPASILGGMEHALRDPSMVTEASSVH